MSNITSLLLRSFEDVLTGSFQGKQYTARIEPNTPCPNETLKLWEQRGYIPSPNGVAFITFKMFRGSEKEYTFPLYFWSI